jgi:L-ascorbate metabolism protein UlaG (beta-lactamase superfamily)
MNAGTIHLTYVGGPTAIIEMGGLRLLTDPTFDPAGTRYEGVEEVARRYAVDVAVLNLGAAQVAAAGPHPLTLTGAEAVEVARAMPSATIVPLHFEGWEHFTESRAEAERAFADAGLTERVAWPEPGRPLAL